MLLTEAQRARNARRHEQRVLARQRVLLLAVAKAAKAYLDWDRPGWDERDSLQVLYEKMIDLRRALPLELLEELEVSDADRG